MTIRARMMITTVRSRSRMLNTNNCGPWPDEIELLFERQRPKMLEPVGQLGAQWAGGRRTIEVRIVKEYREYGRRLYVEPLMGDIGE